MAGETIANKFASERLRRERQTIAAMLQIYCGNRHRSRGNLCGECQGLLDYATLRLERCRFGVEKPACVKCPVHCYLPKQREQIKEVMRYAGPKMLWRHPILSLFHLLDSRREAPTV
jgi:hypothetical protein